MERVRYAKNRRRCVQYRTRMDSDSLSARGHHYNLSIKQALGGRRSVGYTNRQMWQHLECRRRRRSKFHCCLDCCHLIDFGDLRFGVLSYAFFFKNVSEVIRENVENAPKQKLCEKRVK